MPSHPKTKMAHSPPEPRKQPLTREQRNNLAAINMAKSMHGKAEWSEQTFRERHKIDEQNAATEEQLNASPYAKGAGQKLISHLFKKQMGLDESIGIMKAATQAQHDNFQQQAISDARRFRKRTAG